MLPEYRLGARLLDHPRVAGIEEDAELRRVQVGVVLGRRASSMRSASYSSTPR